MLSPQQQDCCKLADMELHDAHLAVARRSSSNRSNIAALRLDQMKYTFKGPETMPPFAFASCLLSRMLASSPSIGVTCGDISTQALT